MPSLPNNAPANALRSLIVSGLMMIFPPVIAVPSAHAENRETAGTAQFFPITFSSFRAAFDAQAREDRPGSTTSRVTGTLKLCQRQNGGILCLLRDRDADAPPPAASGDRIKPPPGRVPQQLRLMAELDAADRIKTLRITGDRADPADQARFIAAVENAVQVWNKQDGLAPQAATLEAALGLTRTDQSSDIGQPRGLTRPYARITCLAAPLSANAAVSCLFEPPPPPSAAVSLP